eukprot:269033-Amphidinium_carterae.1
MLTRLLSSSALRLRHLKKSTAQLFTQALWVSATNSTCGESDCIQRCAPHSRLSPYFLGILLPRVAKLFRTLERPSRVITYARRLCKK